MTEQEHDREISNMVSIESRYMIGTKAYHKLGSLDRDGDLFLATDETEKYWVGMWVTGFGFFNVLFPKETSRNLTEEEVDKYNKVFVKIGGQPAIKLNVK